MLPLPLPCKRLNQSQRVKKRSKILEQLPMGLHFGHDHLNLALAAPQDVICNLKTRLRLKVWVGIARI